MTVSTCAIVARRTSDRLRGNPGRLFCACRQAVGHRSRVPHDAAFRRRYQHGGPLLQEGEGRLHLGLYVTAIGDGRIDLPFQHLER